MRTRRPRSNDAGIEIRFGRVQRPRPNRLSDEATPNVLAGMSGTARSNAGPSWVRTAAAGRRAAIQQPRRAQAAASGAERSEPGRATPNWMTVAIVGFFLLSILRACLQG